MDFSWQCLISSLTTFALLLTATVARESPLYHFCIENQGNFTRSSTYKANLNRLLSSFSSDHIANDYGFYNISSGQGSDVVNSIALCRGDVSSGDCLGCINNAARELRNRCPNQKEAIIWYDYCMLRYSNRSIFGLEEGYPRIYMWDLNNVTNVEAFDQALNALLDSLISSASSGNSLRKFATGSSQVAAFQTIYALVQCTPGLTSIQCSSCLSQCVSDIPRYCDRSQECGLIGPSCYLRFDIDRFYNLTTSDTPLRSPSPPPATPTSASTLSPSPLNDTKSTIGKKRNSSRTIVIVTVSVVAFLVLAISSYIFFFPKERKSKLKVENGTKAMATQSDLKFYLSMIETATNNFAEVNKIGAGGFGTVYKGILPNGQEIAVKRLSSSSEQGAQEFQTEVSVVAKLQHRNLVKLLGYCQERKERMLIYEFVPNKSLDYFLFDPEKQRQLDWPKRYKIIKGIARGLLYIHSDSHLKIIHRDLKAGNVLLDEDMTPKISDFGMAKIFGENKSQERTKRIVGTFGYMSPEYAVHGQFSEKSDVFGFGILMLEIVSGRRNTSFCNSESADNLLTYAWRHWKNGTSMELMDSTLQDSYVSNEVLRCIHIGLLCVQENPDVRPKMARVALMLSSSSVSLPSPEKAAFFFGTVTGTPKLSIVEQKSDQSTTTTTASSATVNEASITELFPR